MSVIRALTTLAFLLYIGAWAAAPTFVNVSAIAASTGADVTVTLPAHLTNDIFLMIGVVLLATAAAFELLSRPAAAAGEVMAKADAAASRSQGVHETWSRVIQQAGDRYSVAAGDITQGSLGASESIRAVNDAFAAQSAEIRANFTELGQQENALAALAAQRDDAIWQIRETNRLEEEATGKAKALSAATKARAASSAPWP